MDVSEVIHSPSTEHVLSQALNALVCPTAADSDRKRISEATAILSKAKSGHVISSLSSIAFNDSEPVEVHTHFCDDMNAHIFIGVPLCIKQYDSHCQRREGALVLLRSRLLLWDPSEDEKLKEAIQQALSNALMSAQDHLLAWRVASVVSALFCTVSNPYVSHTHAKNHTYMWATSHTHRRSHFDGTCRHRVGISCATAQLRICNLWRQVQIKQLPSRL